jgi:putative glutamine amidotransferase
MTQSTSPRIAIPMPHSDPEYSNRALPHYVNAIEQAGGQAVLINLNQTNAAIAQLLKSCDAVLLPGSSADVDPQKYGSDQRHARTSASDPARDNVDELLLQDAHNMRKPLLGICYGTQTLNVWRTGTLRQHIESAVNHEAGKSVPIAHHAEVVPGSHLASILGLNTDMMAKSIPVNSSHHQAVETAGDGLRVVARSPRDGVIEAIEGTSKEHFVLGVQWHPERSPSDEYSRRLFSAFVEAAREWHTDMMRNSKQDFETLSH